MKMGYKVSNLLQFDLPKKVLQIQVQTRQESSLNSRITPLADVSVGVFLIICHKLKSLKYKAF